MHDAPLKVLGAGARLPGYSSCTASFSASVTDPLIQAFAFGYRDSNDVAMQLLRKADIELAGKGFSRLDPAPIFLDTNLGLNRV